MIFWFFVQLTNQYYEIKCNLDLHHVNKQFSCIISDTYVKYTTITYYLSLLSLLSSTISNIFLISLPPPLFHHTIILDLLSGGVMSVPIHSETYLWFDIIVKVDLDLHLWCLGLGMRLWLVCCLSHHFQN